jgi:DNA-binding Xre family transcriptional regulator
MLMLSVGRCRIPELLSSRKMTQQELADRTGIAKSTISAYCVGRRILMPLVNALLIADVLNCEPRDLYEWHRN